MSSQSVVRLRPPDLIIQDELHLSSADSAGVLRDRWAVSKTGPTRLGYRKRAGKEPLNGLLTEAGGGAWTELTAAMSMRESADGAGTAPVVTLSGDDWVIAHPDDPVETAPVLPDIKDVT